MLNGRLPARWISMLNCCFSLSIGDRYVVETDGLLIKEVVHSDAGTYTCRARVLETGSLEERDIKLEASARIEFVIQFFNGVWECDCDRKDESLFLFTKP